MRGREHGTREQALRKECGTREQDTLGLMVSLLVGGLISVLLCAVLPGIESKADTLTLYMALWFLSTVATWTIVDIRENLADRKRWPL